MDSHKLIGHANLLPHCNPLFDYLPRFSVSQRYFFDANYFKCGTMKHLLYRARSWFVHWESNHLVYPHWFLLNICVGNLWSQRKRLKSRKVRWLTKLLFGLFICEFGLFPFGRLVFVKFCLCCTFSILKLAHLKSQLTSSIGFRRFCICLYSSLAIALSILSK